MMLPLVRLDEQSHSGVSGAAALPAHLAEVCMLLLNVIDILIQVEEVLEVSEIVCDL